MIRITTVVVTLCTVIGFSGATSLNADVGKQWPQWRGPQGTGVAPGDPPLQWDEHTHVKWKTEIPGKGHATPIVWGDRIFVLASIQTGKQVQARDKDAEPASTARASTGGRRRNMTAEQRAEMRRRFEQMTPEEREQRRRRWRRNFSSKPTHAHKFSIMAIDRRDGQILWQETTSEELPHEGSHRDGSFASNSPVTDGEHVYAYFGSRGLYCYDMDGNLKWENNLGDMKIRMGFGEGSSPVLYGETLVVNWDHEGQSFIVALDKRTGEERWKVDRDEPTTWATPIVVESAGKQHVITNGTNLVRGYDLVNGNLIWHCSGMTLNVIPSPVYANGIVYLASGFRGNAMLAVRLGSASGNIDDTEAIVWKYNRDTPYVPSLLLYDGLLYMLKRNDGILSCLNADSGEQCFTEQRLEGIDQVFASPVGAGGRVYVVGTNGTTLVLEHGDKYKILAKNTLDDRFTSSPAIAGNELYLRGHKALYCIGMN